MRKTPLVLGTGVAAEEILNIVYDNSAIPDAILKILKYKACRGAIKFGDYLS